MRGRAWVMVSGVIAALVAVTVIVVAVAGNGDGVDPRLITRSVDRALASGSARVVFSFTLDAPPGFEEQAGSFGGDGVFDFAGRRSHVRLRVSDSLGGDGEGSTPAEGRLEIIVDGTTTLVRMAELTRAAGGAHEWFRVDLDELARVTGRSQLGLGASDPAQTLDYLRGTASDPVEVGKEPVAGVPTTHFAATLDLARAAAAAPAGRREQVGAAVAQFRDQFGTTRFPVDVWIDDDGFPRRLRYELDLSDFDASGEIPAGAIMSFTMELFDYGTDAPVEAPPPDTVGDLTTLLARLTEEGTGTAT